MDYHDPTIGLYYNPYGIHIFIQWKDLIYILLLFIPEDSYQQQAVIDGEAALLDILGMSWNLKNTNLTSEAILMIIYNLKLDTAGQVEFTGIYSVFLKLLQLTENISIFLNKIQFLTFSYARSVHALRRGFYNLLFGNRQTQFSRSIWVSKIDCKGSLDWRYSIGTNCKQIGPTISTKGEHNQSNSVSSILSFEMTTNQWIFRCQPKKENT